MRSRGIRRVWISPAQVEASAEAVEAIRAADLIVLGPGSLYTSLLPSLLVPGIRSALEAARRSACTWATSRPSRARPRVHAVRAHGRAPGARGGLARGRRARQRQRAGAPSDRTTPRRRSASTWPAAARRALVTADVVDDANAHRHDPTKLATALIAPARRAPDDAGAGRRPHRLRRRGPAWAGSGRAGPRPRRRPASRAGRHRAAARLLPRRRAGRPGCRGPAAPAPRSWRASRCGWTRAPAGARPRDRPFDWAGARPTAGWRGCGGGSLRSGSLSLGGGTRPPRVRRSPGRGAGARRAARVRSACPPRGGSAAGAGW